MYADQLGWCQGGQCRHTWQSHGVSGIVCSTAGVLTLIVLGRDSREWRRVFNKFGEHKLRQCSWQNQLAYLQGSLGNMLSSGLSRNKQQLSPGEEGSFGSIIWKGDTAMCTRKGPLPRPFKSSFKKKWDLRILENLSQPTPC